MIERLTSPVPFHTFLWKIASRCNLDCTYCYVYNQADHRWREQPHFMSASVARQVCKRVREHLASRNKQTVQILFHGGEPLLGGLDHLNMLLEVIEEELRGFGLHCDISMQSNGVLLTRDIAELLLRRQVSIGISVDGPPGLNDRARIDHQSRGTGERVEAALALLSEWRYRSLLSGLLCVIDIDYDSVQVIDYLMSFNPRGIDFIFPFDNHDRRPKGKEQSLEVTPYGDWLIAAFDRWWQKGAPGDVRVFSAIARRLCGSTSGFESVGLDPANLIVVETNGGIEGADGLKAAYNGATFLGFNVFDHDFDTVARHAAVRRRQSGVDELCQKCKECAVVDVCGGGYIAHRYSAMNGLNNPSVYSSDLEKLIRHIHAVLSVTVTSQSRLTARQTSQDYIPTQNS
jgi:uncharacterized protein